MKLFWKMDLTGAAIFLALPAIAYWTQILPAMHRDLAASAATLELEKQRATQAGLQQTLTTLSGAATAKPNTLQPTLRLAPLSDLNRRLAEINDLASTHGLTIDALSPGDALGRDGYAVTTIDVSAQGTYRACQSWMSDLHGTLPDVTVAQWQLTSVTTDTHPQIKLTATLRWYALPKLGSR